ncbi:MAG: hypothetical protein FWE03_07020 [Firmicutes bacterium]|nr:hypothetical protein [Bacillota bacterium]
MKKIRKVLNTVLFLGIMLVASLIAAAASVNTSETVSNLDTVDISQIILANQTIDDQIYSFKRVHDEHGGVQTFMTSVDGAVQH